MNEINIETNLGVQVLESLLIFNKKTSFLTATKD